MKNIFSATLALIVLAIFVSSAQAINISSASVQNGLAAVSGKAAANANISWEGANVAKANKNGGFSFSFGVVPADCIGSLSDGVSTINVQVLNCTPKPKPTSGVLKTGQKTCYDSVGGVITCTGTGQDGEFQKGLARSYTDNGDGTIADNVTGLMWEKLTDDGTIHDKDNVYLWGEAFAVKIAALNTVPCFAGHCDWRLPNINELQTLTDYGRANPAIDPVFNDEVSSFTAPDNPYWSSTTVQWPGGPVTAWTTNSGAVWPYDKDFYYFYVRAVRGGL